MRLLPLILLLCAQPLFAQNNQNAYPSTPIRDSILICNDSLCLIIERSNTQIKGIRLPPKGSDLKQYYQRNCKNFTNHEISQAKFEQVFLQDHSLMDFVAKPRWQRRIILKDIIRQNSYAYSEANRMMDFIKVKNGFCNKDSLYYTLEKVHDYRAASFLLDGFNAYLYFDVLEQHEKERNWLKAPYIKGLIENRRMITTYIDFLIKQSYFNYNQSTSTATLIKGSTIFHDNDVFMPLLNEDKYYTGGGRLEVYTDFLRINYIQNFFNRNYSYLSYQGVFAEVKAFTPFIRYNDYINGSIDTLGRLQAYEQDRPFASYEYLGFANYKLHHKGHKRVKTQYRFGQIGNRRSEQVQGVLHRDQFVKSIKVIGWENQIANGGRYGVNFDYRRDWMLFSPGHDVFDRNKEKAEREARKNRQMHIHGSVEMNVGNFLTAAEVGVGISNLSFKERDNSNNFRLRPGYNTSWLLYANLGLRYVHHNTSLEGFGVFNTQEDDPTEDIPSNNYVIDKKDVARIIGLAEMGVGFRVRRATLFYKLAFHTREIKNPPSDFIYGWGTVGMSFTNLSLFGKTD